VNEINEINEINETEATYENIIAAVESEPEVKEGLISKFTTAFKSGWKRNITEPRLRKKTEKNELDRIRHEAKIEAMQELKPAIIEQIKKEEMDKLTGKAPPNKFMGAIEKVGKALAAEGAGRGTGTGQSSQDKIKNAFSMGGGGSNAFSMGGGGGGMMSAFQQPQQAQPVQRRRKKKTRKTQKVQQPLSMQEKMQNNIRKMI